MDKFERLAQEIDYELAMTIRTIEAYERDLFGWYDPTTLTFHQPTVTDPAYKPVTISMRQRHLFIRNTLQDLSKKAAYIRRSYR